LLYHAALAESSGVEVLCIGRLDYAFEQRYPQPRLRAGSFLTASWFIIYSHERLFN
jgi:hypothetical protein